MNRAEYLAARGWVRTRSQPGDFEVWRDPVYVAADGSVELTTQAYLDEESAERRQLDRDAAARDYLEARRPGIVEVVMGAIWREVDGQYEVLLGKRSGGYEFPGAWCLPGGKVEAGETCEAALFRELVEETGVQFEVEDIIDGPYVADFDPPVTRKRVRIVGFDLRFTALHVAPVALDGLDEVRWFEVTDLPADKMTPATFEFLRWQAKPPLHVSRARVDTRVT